MQKQKIQLPSINQPLKSSRITNFEEYAKWQKQRKQAYRDQLQNEIIMHDQNKQRIIKEKQQARSQANNIAEDEAWRRQAERHTKVKTEQKYMLENWNMSKETHNKTPHKHMINPQSSYKEHPFVKLIDLEEKRKQETKNNFIFQNKLNSIQSEVRISLFR